MNQWMAVAFGGALGSSLRYLVGLVLAAHATSAFPLATWLVNLAGSFLLALLTPWLMSNLDFSTPIRLLWTTGLCGGFTTYSTFNLEWTTLMLDGKTGAAAFYVVATGLGCGGAGFFGGWLARTLWSA